MPTRRTIRRWSNYLFLAPYLAVFSLFLVAPLLFGFGLSFVEWEMLSPTPPHWCGLANYAEAMRDPYFWGAVGATLKFAVLQVPLNIGDGPCPGARRERRSAAGPGPASRVHLLPHAGIHRSCGYLVAVVLQLRVRGVQRAARAAGGEGAMADQAMVGDGVHRFDDALVDGGRHVRHPAGRCAADPGLLLRGCGDRRRRGPSGGLSTSRCRSCGRCCCSRP